MYYQSSIITSVAYTPGIDPVKSFEVVVHSKSIRPATFNNTSDVKYNVSVLPSHGAGLNARIFCVPVCPKQRPERNSPQNLKTYSPNVLDNNYGTYM